MIRGDRRSTPRATPDRRKQIRTPGKFKDCCDVAFKAIRKLQEQKNERK